VAGLEPWKGVADGKFCHDVLGIKTDPKFRPQFRPDPEGPLATALPSPYAGYFELAFVLESVAACRETDRFTMLELGAGYGPWLVTAHRARQIFGSGAIRLVGVEMVAQHIQWLREHLANNGIDPDEHRLIQAAVSDVDGHAYYRPEENPWLDFGQTVSRRSVRGGSGAPGESGGTADGSGDIRVDALGLPALLRELERVDLLHADMQGEEGRALPAALDELNHRVSRLIVATHSRRIHRRLRRMLSGSRWTIVFDFRCRKWERTEYGDVKFLDGLLAAVNTSLP
jgi:FkbM family methyltransferase